MVEYSSFVRAERELTWRLIWQVMIWSFSSVFSNISCATVFNDVRDEMAADSHIYHTIRLGSKQIYHPTNSMFIWYQFKMTFGLSWSFIQSGVNWELLFQEYGHEATMVLANCGFVALIPEICKDYSSQGIIPLRNPSYYKIGHSSAKSQRSAISLVWVELYSCDPCWSLSCNANVPVGLVHGKPMMSHNITRSDINKLCTLQFNIPYDVGYWAVLPKHLAAPFYIPKGTPVGNHWIRASTPTTMCQEKFQSRNWDPMFLLNTVKRRGDAASW